MNNDLRVAFVSSPAPWFGRYHGHITDHGPGRVVAVVAEPRSAFAEDWRLLVIDANSRILDRDFVELVAEGGPDHGQPRGLLAVWDPAQPQGKQRALDAGVKNLVEADASFHEFATALVAAAAEIPVRPGRTRPRVVAVPVRAARHGQVVAVGGPAGVDAEPVLIGMARAFGGRREVVAVVDANEVAPSLAQRLGLTPVPNLASVAAQARATSAELDASLQAVEDVFWALAGLAEPSQWDQVPARSVRSMVSGFADRYDRTLVAVGPVLEDLRGVERFAISRAVLAEADAVVAVGLPTPMGLTRLAMWVGYARSCAPVAPLYLAVADAPRDRVRRGDITDFLADLSPVGTFLLPAGGRRRARADWNGELARGGPLDKALGRMAKEVSQR